MSSRALSWTLGRGAVALVVGAAFAAAYGTGILSEAQVAASDLLFETRAVQPARSTVIIGIDERSYRTLRDQYGALSQWPRTLYAQALDALRASDAPRVIAFEVFFDGARPEDDVLAAAMARAGNVVTPVVAQGACEPAVGRGVPPRFDRFQRPAPTITRAAAAEGLANVTVASDGVVRGLPALLRAGDEQLPAMALAVAALYARRPTVLDGPAEPGVVRAAGRAIPVRAGDVMAINFLGPPSSPDGRGPFHMIPFIDVLEGRFDRSLVRDRIALIGPAIRGIDEHATPTSAQNRMWGVEVLANGIETVLSQRHLVPEPAAMVVAAIFALSGLGVAATGLRRVWLAALAALALLGAYLTLAAVLFEAGFVLDLIHAPAALLVGFGLGLGHRAVFAEEGRRLAAEAMDRYLSPAVGRWVREDPRRLTLGGEQREMTVLFTDLRQFTTLSHSLPPETLVALLNRYRAIVSDVVFAHDGVIVQFAGDAIEAFWNAPMDQPDHARRACRAALEMSAAVQAIRHEFAAEGWSELDVGIGINTGRMVVGNFGSRRRLEYAVVGDPVNVAARLEGLTKFYGAHIVAGEETRAAAGSAFVWRFLDVVAVRGRPEPLYAWEVLGAAGAVLAETAARLDRYHEGVELYRARRFVEAEKVFASLLEAAPADGPVAFYLARARQAVLDPPPPDWDGVHNAAIK